MNTINYPQLVSITCAILAIVSVVLTLRNWYRYCHITEHGWRSQERRDELKIIIQFDAVMALLLWVFSGAVYFLYIYHT